MQRSRDSDGGGLEKSVTGQSIPSAEDCRRGGWTTPCAASRKPAIPAGLKCRCAFREATLSRRIAGPGRSLRYGLPGPTPIQRPAKAGTGSCHFLIAHGYGARCRETVADA